MPPDGSTGAPLRLGVVSQGAPRARDGLVDDAMSARGEARSRGGSARDQPVPLAVELRGVLKSFGAVRAVRGIDLPVRPGEVMASLGPNGAGKTSTIDMILGLSRPTSGQVRSTGWAHDHRLSFTSSGGHHLLLSAATISRYTIGAMLGAALLSVAGIAVGTLIRSQVRGIVGIFFGNSSSGRRSAPSTTRPNAFSPIPPSPWPAPNSATRRPHCRSRPQHFSSSVLW
jgi:hypothetical protein